MSNINHNIHDDDIDANPKCLKCELSWHFLYTKASKIRRFFENETAIEYVNKVYPCITDEEAIIKKLLE